MDPFPTLGSRLLVLYDGHCILCHRSVRWLLRHDTLDRLRFASAADPHLAPHLAPLLAGLTPGPAASILVFRNPGLPTQHVYVRSAAVLALLAELPRPWPAVAALLRLIPRPLRDLAYRLVARTRYRLFGRLPACPIPTPAERSRFL